jgi:hypothetical protein
VYDQLFVSSMGLRQELVSAEDSLLLLTALISDFLLQRRLLAAVLGSQSFEQVDRNEIASDSQHSFSLLSPRMQYVQLLSQTSAALMRWHVAFAANASPGVLALHSYAKLLLVCPILLQLPQLANYPPSMAQFDQHQDIRTDVKITDEAHGLAWQILDHVASATTTSGKDTAIWLPPITFHAALVVWQKLKASSQGHGSLRVLDTFKKALEQMPWPCCAVMITTLNEIPTLP